MGPQRWGPSSFLTLMSHENELEVQRTLGRIEGRLEEIQASFTVLVERQNNQSNRLDALEKWKNWSTGIYVGVSTFVLILWAVLTHK